MSLQYEKPDEGREKQENSPDVMKIMCRRAENAGQRQGKG